MLISRVLPYFLFSSLWDRIGLCLAGIIISIYALNIELKHEKNPAYKAYCDISEKMSCSKVLSSEYGKGFGVVGLLVGKEHFLNMPNCVLGIVFYSLQILLAWSSASGLAVSLAYYTSILSAMGSLYLAVILFFVLKDVCLVCITTYVINAGLLYLNYSIYNLSY